MLRSVSLFALLAVAQSAHGQDKLLSLRQASEKTYADWAALSAGLEPKIARLLPCDPNARAAVEDVSKASAARLTALSAYLHAETTAARQLAEAAKQVLSAQASIGGAWAAERAESDQDHTAIEAQIADLKESMRRRGALSAAEQVLVDLSRIAKDRASKADEQATRKDQVNILLGTPVAAYADRVVALEKEAALLDQEIARWTTYYASRVARAATECAIISRKK